jgi:FKBP-type peptidyl-prolyl cis-trans isomerase FkpA
MLLIVGMFQSCGKDTCDLPFFLPQITNQNVYDSDLVKINNYLENNMLIANSTSSGLHYIIEDEGDMKKPEMCDIVNVKYLGYRLDGVAFDSSESVNFLLYNLIPSWREGIPLIGKGGKMTILSPSYLAYGANSPSSLIPANSVLIFEIELLDF